jgi:hypothetical protein
MTRLAFLVLAAAAGAALAGCTPDKPKPQPPPPDTTPLNMDSIKTAIPPAAPDTFKPPKSMRLPPPAPAALIDAVQREQSFSRFCYEEYGQKADPSLHGGVAMVVTVGKAGITDAHVAADTWSSRDAGRAVNACLNEKAAQAWKPEPGSVKPGEYLVQLQFRPS